MTELYEGHSETNTVKWSVTQSEPSGDPKSKCVLCLPLNFWQLYRSSICNVSLSSLPPSLHGLLFSDFITLQLLSTQIVEF